MINKLLEKNLPNNTQFASSNEMENYTFELSELNKIVGIKALFVSDDSPLMYRPYSRYEPLKSSTLNFLISKLQFAYAINFFHFFHLFENQHPKTLDVVKYIRENRINETIYEIPNNIKYFAGIVKIIDENNKKEISLCSIIDTYEKYEYKKKYYEDNKKYILKSVINTALLEGKEEYEKLFINNKYIVFFDNKKQKSFSKQIDIYNFLINNIK